MPYLNIRKGGATYQVPLMTSAKYASPTGVPCFCAYLNGTVYYALTSSLSTNAVAAFRYGGKTYYLVTKHEDSEVGGWELIYNNTSMAADTYELPEKYAEMPIKIECGGGAGSSGSNGCDTTMTYNKRENTAATGATPVYKYYSAYLNIYGGAGGSGGNGGEATAYAGPCNAGTVFEISRADGNKGSNGNAGSYPSSISNAAKEGGSGGSGGIGFSVSVKNAAGETVTCTAYGGGGGGGGGGAGATGENTQLLYYNTVPRYTYPTGTGGNGGASGLASGSSGVAGETGDTSSGGRIDLGNYKIRSDNNVYDTIKYNASRYYGAGGAGGSSGSSTSAYCRIYAGSLR